MANVHEGGCLCGCVRFRVAGEPSWVGVCHCKPCQRRTGSAFGISVIFEDAQVEAIDGVLRTFEYRSDESGRWLRTQFCEKCGSSVTWTLELLPGERVFAGGAFDDIQWVPIDNHIWTRSAHDAITYPPGSKIYTGDEPEEVDEPNE